MRLKDKYSGWALVTGASSGIGEAFARYLAKEGLPLVLVARRADRLNTLAKELSDTYGVYCHVISQDLAAPDMLAHVAREVGDRPIDILVNNAGFGLHGNFCEQEPAELAKMAQLNMTTPVLLTRHFAPRMVEQKKGVIIFIASVVAFHGFPLLSLYSASKGFNLLLGEALCGELKEHGVDVVTVSPGTTATEFHGIAKMRAGGPFNKPRPPMKVVETAFRHLGKRPSVVDGVLNAINMAMLNLVPRRFRPGILKKAMQGQAL